MTMGGLFDVDALNRLAEVRAELFAAIKKALEEDDYCKSDEGCFEITLPNYFESQYGEPEGPWAVTLHCYVIGPGRHYTWVGDTLAEAVDKACREIRAWLSGEWHDERLTQDAYLRRELWPELTRIFEEEVMDE